MKWLNQLRMRSNYVQTAVPAATALLKHRGSQCESLRTIRAFGNVLGSKFLTHKQKDLLKNRLLSLLDSSDSSCRLMAATLLAKGNESSAAPVLREYAFGEKWMYYPNKSDSDPVDPRSEAMYYFAHFGVPDDEDPIIRLFTVCNGTSNSPLRAACVRAIGQIRGPRAYEFLCESFRAESAREVKEKFFGRYFKSEDCLHALAMLKDPRVFDFIEGLQRKPQDNFILYGILGDARSLPILSKYLWNPANMNDDPAYMCLENAIDAVGEIKDVRGLDPLIRLLDHQEFSVVKHAFEALCKIGRWSQAQLVTITSRVERINHRPHPGDPCFACKGSGRLRGVNLDGMSRLTRCPDCDGTGRYRPDILFLGSRTTLTIPDDLLSSESHRFGSAPPSGLNSVAKPTPMSS
jgi:hypothetical protein